MQLESSNKLVAHSLVCARQDSHSQASRCIKTRVMKTIYGAVQPAS